MADLNFTLHFTPDTGNLAKVLGDIQSYFNSNAVKLTFDKGDIKSSAGTAVQTIQKEFHSISTSLTDSITKNLSFEGAAQAARGNFNKVLNDIGGNIDNIKEKFKTITIGRGDGKTEQGILTMSAKVSDAAGMVTKVTREYNLATGDVVEKQRELIDNSAKLAAQEERAAAAAERQAAAEQKAADNLNRRAADAQQKYGLAYQQKQADYLKGTGLDDAKIDAAKTALTGLQDAYSACFDAQGKFVGQGEDLDRLAAAAQAYRTELQGVDSTLSNQRTAAEKFQSLSSFVQQYNSQISKSPYWTQQFNNALNELSQAQATGAKDSKVIQADVQKLQATFLASGAAASTFGDKIREVFTRNWDLMLVRTAIQYIRRLAKEMWTSVKDIDAALTQVRIVSGESGTAIKQFAQDAVQAGKEIGSSAVNIIKSTETYARLGYTLKEATELARETTIFSQIADIDVDDATAGMTSILKGFQKDADDAEYISDVLTKVGQSYAVSASELSTALQNTSAAMFQANTSFEQSVALIAAGNAAVQDASKVGNALKTTSLRIRGAKSDLEEAGLDTDGMAKSVSKLREELKALTNIDIMIDDENFKDLYQIMLELSEVWSDLTDVSRANILELLAGKRNSQVVASIITNIKDMEGAYDAATNAAGTAAQANAIYLDSIQGRTAQLKASFEGLATTTINSGDVKGLVSALTGIVNVLNSIVKVTGLLPPILAAITAYKIVDHAKQFNAAAMQVTSGIQAGAISAQQAMGVLANLNTKDRERILTLIDEQIETMQLTVAEKEQTLATIRLTEAQQSEMLQSIETTNSKIAEAQAIRNVAMSMNEQSAASKNAAVSAKNIPVAGWIGIIITVLSFAGNQWRKYKQDQEQAAQATAASLDDIADKAKNIDDTVARIKELNTELDSNNISQQEAYDARAEVLRLSGQLQEAYGEEARLLGMNSAALDNYASKLKEKVATDWYAQNAAEFRKAREAMQKETTETVSFGISGDYGIDNLPTSGLYKMLENMENDFLSIDASRQVFMDENKADWVTDITIQNKTVTEQIELWTQLIGQIREYQKTLDTATEGGAAEFQYSASLIEVISNKINELNNATYQSHKKTLDEGMEYYIMSDKDYRQYYSQIVGLEEAYTEAVKKGDATGIQKAAERIRNALFSVNSMEIADEDVRQFFINMLTELQNTANANPVIIKAQIEQNQGAYNTALGAAGVLGGYSSNDIINALNGGDLSGFDSTEITALYQMKTAMDEIGVSAEGLVGYMRDVDGMFEQISETAGNTDIVDTWDDIDDILEDLKGSQEDVADAFETSTENVENTQEAYDAYLTVMDDAKKGTEEYDEALETLSDYSGIAADQIADNLPWILQMLQGDFASTGGTIEYMFNELMTLSGVQFSTGNWQGELNALTNSTDTSISTLATLIQYLLSVSGATVSVASDGDKAKVNVSVPNLGKRPGGGGKKSGGGGGGGGGRDSIISEAYENLNDLNEHYLKLSKERMSRLEKETVEYRVELGKQYAYAKRMAEAASAELARLRAAGYNESNEEYRKLLEQYEKYLSDMYDYAKDIWEAEKEARIKALEEQKDAEDKRWEEREKQLDYEIDKQEALIDLEKERQGVVGDIRSEYRELDKQLAAAKAQTAYLDESVRDALFSDADYKKLTSELKNIENQAESLYEVYQEKINGVTAENAYELEGITEEFERQYELLLKQYEVSKADLATARARRELENVMNERNVAMLVNGVWTWVADPEAVKGAVEAVYDAQADAEDALNELVDTQKLQALEQFKTDLEMRKEAEEAAHDNIIDGLDDQIDAIDKLKFNFAEFSNTLENGGKDVASAITEAVKAILDAKDAALAAIGAAKGSGGGGGGGKTAEEKIADIVSKNNAKDLAGSWRRDPGYTPIKSGGSGSFKPGATNRLMAYASGGVNDYTGMAHLDGTKTRPEIVFNNADAAKLYSLVHNTDDLGAMLGSKIAGSLLGALLNPNGAAKSIINNSTNGGNVYIDGVQITGNDAKTLIDVFSRVVPTYSI